jgi:predicted TIM-barrel fold metal-dependent hydrolase
MPAFKSFHEYDRRTFLIGASACAAAALAGEPASAEAPLPVIVDTHTHFYDPTRAGGVPWPGKNDKVLYRPVLPKHFREVAAPCGVTGTVVVEASPLVEDNQWLLDLAKEEPSIVGIVGHLSPGQPEFAGHLARFAKNPLYRGIRVNHAELKQGLETKAFLDDLARLADADLALDLNGGPELPHDVARLAGKLPKLRIVINHCANLPIDGREPPADWLAGMQAAAAQERVWCKVSALVEGASPDGKRAPTDAEYYTPVLDALWKTFGERRLVYGSNWPVSERAGSYRAVFDIVAAYFGARGAEAKRKFFADNSLAAYKWQRRH